MPLELLPRFVPSSNPYAFSASRTEYSRGTFILPAMWAGRKNGLLTATIGTYRIFDMKARLGVSAKLDKLMEVADTRYGGDWHAKYVEGSQSLVINPKHPLTLAEHTELWETLAQAVSAYPEVPAGYTGWYYRA